jgi:glucans biosynthesis protein C
MPPTPSHQPRLRRNDLDWLRVLAVLLLIPFHAALIFVLDPNSIMYVKDSANSEFLDGMAGFIHQFHMPLFFVISGAATALALGFRGAGQYLRERAQRMLVPFLFAVVVLLPPMTYITRLQRGESLTFWQHYAGFFQLNPNDLAGYYGTLTPAHTWFILYLLIFSLISLPFFLLERRESSRRISAKIAGFFEKRFALSLLLIPLALAAALDLMGDKNPLYYFFIFLLGYLLMTDPRYQAALDRDAPVTLGLGLLCAIVRQTWSPNFPEWSLPWLGYGLIVEQGVRLWLLFGILGYGHRLLQGGGKVLRYLSEAAFPFYILHLPVTTLVGYFVIRLETEIGVKYLLIVVLANLLTFGIYEGFKRLSILRFLLGMKTRTS